ncbi:MAG: cation:proton antiporter [Salinivirgaceae bacterium]
MDILNLFLVLLAAWAGGSIARRLGYPAILGELVIGIILGPALLGWLGHSETIKVLADVGIILLMVYVGMEIDFRDLKKASWAGMLAAIGGFIVPFALGYFTVIWFEGTQMAALFVAIAVGVTSLATKSRILVDLKLLNTRIAYVLMAGALISDTLALLIFAGIVSFAEAGAFNVGELFPLAIKIVSFFAATIAIGLYILPLLGRYLSRSKFKNSTFYFTAILLVAFGYAELAELAGMHSILGAFMAGLFIKDNLFPKNISKEVHKAFYDVSIGFLAPVFFVSAGFFVDIGVFQTDLPFLITVVIVAVVGKIFGTALFYLPSGHGWREGITVGAGMNGRGAVEIIIAGIALEMGIIDNVIFSILVFMAIFTTLTVPVLLKWTTVWLRNRGELVNVGQRTGFLIVGVNRLSLLVAKHIKESSYVKMIDTNIESVNWARSSGFDCLHGNALKEDVLASATPEHMATFIGLTGNSEVNVLAAQVARESFYIPEAFVAISDGKDGVGIEMLDTVKVVSMFAMRVELTTWCAKISDGSVSEKRVKVSEQIDTREWVRRRRQTNPDFLPIIVECVNGTKKPFRFEDTLEPEDHVILLEG